MFRNANRYQLDFRAQFLRTEDRESGDIEGGSVFLFAFWKQFPFGVAMNCGWLDRIDIPDFVKRLCEPSISERYIRNVRQTALKEFINRK